MFVTSDGEPNLRLCELGYEPEVVIRESRTKSRGVYRNVTNADVTSLITQEGVLRDLILAKRDASISG